MSRSLGYDNNQCQYIKFRDEHKHGDSHGAPSDSELVDRTQVGTNSLYQKIVQRHN